MVRRAAGRPPARPPGRISRHLVAGLLAGRPSAAPRTSAETPLPEIVVACNAFQPQALVGYPSVHALPAQEQLAGRLRIAPSVIADAGEVLAPDMRDRIREAWGVEPASMYCTTEAAVIASGCRAGVGMHVWEEHALVAIGAALPPIRVDVVAEIPREGGPGRS